MESIQEIQEIHAIQEMSYKIPFPYLTQLKLTQSIKVSCSHVLHLWLWFTNLDFPIFGPMSARSYKIGVVGSNWLVGCLVGNAVFLKTALIIFLIFCLKLGDYKGRKVTEQDFWKKFLIWRYSPKRLQISPKLDTLIFF